MAPTWRPLVIAAAVTCVATIVAAWHAPAALVDWRIAQVTGSRVRLADAEGTVWRARGNLVAGTAIVPVAWRLEAWPLLHGELRFQLVDDARSASASPRAEIAIASGIALRGVDASFPATLAVAAAGLDVSWIAGGNLSVRATAMNWAPPSSSGEAVVQWRQARLTGALGTTPLDLGDVSLPLKADGDRLLGTLSNTGGDLAVRGDVAFRAAQGVEISLLLTPRRADNADLIQVLSVLGIAESGGWRINWKQVLR